MILVFRQGGDLLNIGSISDMLLAKICNLQRYAIKYYPRSDFQKIVQVEDKQVASKLVTHLKPINRRLCFVFHVHQKKHTSILV